MCTNLYWCIIYSIEIRSDKHWTPTRVDVAQAAFSRLQFINSNKVTLGREKNLLLLVWYPHKYMPLLHCVNTWSHSSWLCPDLNYYLQYYTNKQLVGLSLLLIVMMFNGLSYKETALVDEAVCTVCVAHIRYLPNDPNRFWRRYHDEIMVSNVTLLSRTTVWTIQSILALQLSFDLTDLWEKREKTHTWEKTAFYLL